MPHPSMKLFVGDGEISHNMSTLLSKLKSRLSQSNGAAFLISFLSKSYFVDSAKLLVLGSIIETGRRLCRWFLVRFRIQYSITAQFNQGDPAYEWMLHFLNDQQVWKRACDFQVSAKSSARKWGINSGIAVKSHSVDYVPTYALPQLFRWQGYWLEIMRPKSQNNTLFAHPELGQLTGLESIFITVYTLDMSVLSAIVEQAHQRYIEVSRPDVIIHTADTLRYHHHPWGGVKRQPRRSFNSIILQEGVLDSIRQDAKEFLETQAWYTERGIPHRRGYLLYGPPGSGKSSTIFALAGELGMEIYSLSLASNFVDDSFLQHAAASIPKNSIFLIEDIDCALPSRADIDEDQLNSTGSIPHMLSTRRRAPQSRVTLSTLLNVIDGVGSEEGRLFFTTTASTQLTLLRPGRIDRKVQCHLATNEQATALFKHLFSSDANSSTSAKISEANYEMRLQKNINELSNTFSLQVPPHEFSIAELQGYLLGYKNKAEKAVEGFATWVEEERQYKRDQKEREDVRRKTKEKNESKGSST
ncbi:P-loop containing nucleoside triphosphate hydrolase protein [Lentinula aciculospora]|uniref:P-loop containing nucleoside triphosphate hydrolase protein n=1 Tax=Lentinula aciculospora TaxID=153920 RepID=A0A9W9AU20_9AGAR|nr:P-loop containing nucleoside triphosphate hydrolase protein [Lentinula aciculospora]